MRNDNTGALFEGNDFGSEGNNNPIAYVSGNQLFASVEINFDCDETPSEAYIRGVESNGYDFPQQKVNISGNTMSYPMSASEITLPLNKVDLLEFKIRWQVSIDGGTSWEDVGESENRLYVTWALPIPENPGDFNTPGQEPDPKQGTGYEHLETVFYLGCQYAKEKNSKQQIIDEIWDGFNQSNVKRADGQAMHYYQTWQCGNITSADLIKTKDGQCYSWAALFIDVLKTQGLTEDFFLTFIESVYERDFSGFIIPANFLVKNWNFNEAMMTQPFLSDFPYLNVLSEDFEEQLTINNTYAFSVNDVSDTDGKMGQNNTNPLSNFKKHAIVKVGSKYYDPSYGGHVPYNNTHLNPYEVASIDGYYYDVDIEIDENIRGIDLNGNGFIDSEPVMITAWFIKKESSLYLEMRVREDIKY